MTHVPTLSICVPSRNRQVYFQAVIRALTSSLRHDIELVFVDNSDDPTVMDAFIQPYLVDPRVRYVPSGATVRPMVDNWEVAFGVTTGRLRRWHSRSAPGHGAAPWRPASRSA